MPPTSGPARPSRWLLAMVITAAALVGCSSGGSSMIAVTGAWARASSTLTAPGAAYMTIENNGTAADALVGASSPAATTVEIHETVVLEPATPSEGMGMGGPLPSGSGGSDGGMMGMQPVARLQVPAGGRVELAPGSYHVMLIGLARELRPGDTIEITLRFEKAGEIRVDAPARDG